MFGLEASEPAKKSLKIFQENNINTIIELGAGLGIFIKYVKRGETQKY